MSKYFIAVDGHGNHLNTGDEFDCRIAAARWSHRTGEMALVYEAAPIADEDDDDIEEPEPEVVFQDGEVRAAVAEAREWLCTDNGDDARLTADLETALREFDSAIENDDLVRAYRACYSIAVDWASSDRGGFQALSDIARR